MHGERRRGDVRKYDIAGTLLQTYPVAAGSSDGVGFVELRCDQCTMYYTSLYGFGVGSRISRYDVCNDAQLADFKVDNQRYNGLRLLKENDGVLVTEVKYSGTTENGVRHFDSSAALVYDFETVTYFGGAPKPCPVDRDYHDPGSFWTTSGTLADVIKRIQIVSPHADLQTIIVTYGAVSIEVLNPGRCGCADPPAGMGAWWPFDEAIGSTSGEIANGHDGTHVGGPMPDAGIVSNSLRFDGLDDHVTVSNHPDFNFPTMQFTVDFWIHPDAGEATGTIVRKGVLSPGILNLIGPGYHILYSYSGGGHFLMYLAGTGAGFVTDISPPFTYHADPGEWTFVAITVDGVAGEIELWIDGVLAKTTPILPGCSGDTSNSSPLLIGGSDVAPSPERNFNGRLDELEVFPRVLTQAEILSIYHGGSAGKCKEDIGPPWDEAFCLNYPYVDANVDICNYGVVDATYELNFRGLPIGSSGIGGGCGVPGPTDFDDPSSVGTYYPSPKTIAVTAGKCIIEKVRITKPPLFLAVDEVACYEANIKNLATGVITRMNGSVQARESPCPARIFEATTVLVPKAPRPIEFLLENTLDRNETITVVVEPFDADMSGRKAQVRINGGKPGEPWKGRVFLPPAGDINSPQSGTRVILEVESAERVPFGFQDLVVFADLDEDACGTLEPLISIRLRSPLVSEQDFDTDGLSNDLEVALDLDPYKPNVKEDVLLFYQKAMMGASASIGALSAMPDWPEKSAKITNKVTKQLDDFFSNLTVSTVSEIRPISVVRSAIRTLGTVKEGANIALGYICTLTEKSGLYVQGMTNFGSSGGVPEEYEELLESGKAAEEEGSYNLAMKFYRQAIITLFG